MRNTLLGFILLTVLFISCNKNDNTTCPYNDSGTVASASESAAIQTYLTNNGITGAVKHSSGFYYKITQAGTGKAVTNLCSVVTVNYAGRFTNGTYFDPTTPGTMSTASFTLGQVIVGWQKGLPLISAGGKMTLYIPPSLGYGSTDVKNPSTGVVVIPGNSILIFDVELTAIN